MLYDGEDWFVGNYAEVFKPEISFLCFLGWDQGLLGACVGEKRKLKIPSKLGYGDQGSPPTIPGNIFTGHFLLKHRH